LSSRRKVYLGVWIVVLLTGFIWQLTPFPAVLAVGSLSDPAKLATLGERGANSRLNKIVYWLDQSQRHYNRAEKAVDIALWENGCPKVRAALVKESLLRNLRIAEELGLLTSGNRNRLRQGKAAVATMGPYNGEPVEIDHIVPVSLAPEVGNELANLEMLPKTLNREKSNRVNERQMAHAERLREAGLLTEESYARVKAKSHGRGP
jgi:hypothetical protein